jgi:hypothetical protein
MFVPSITTSLAHLCEVSGTRKLISNISLGKIPVLGKKIDAREKLHTIAYQLVSHGSEICSTKLIVVHLVTNIHPFYGMLSIVIMFTRSSH